MTKYTFFKHFFHLIAVLDDHVRSFFGPRSQEGLYVCNACGSTQRSHSNMTNHVESKHLSLSLKCILCHGISKTRRTFGAHLKYHHKDQTLYSGMKQKQFYTIEDIDRNDRHVLHDIKPILEPIVDMRPIHEPNIDMHPNLDDDTQPDNHFADN